LSETVEARRRGLRGYRPRVHSEDSKSARGESRRARESDASRRRRRRRRKQSRRRRRRRRIERETKRAALV